MRCRHPSRLLNVSKRFLWQRAGRNCYTIHTDGWVNQQSHCRLVPEWEHCSVIVVHQLGVGVLHLVDLVEKVLG